MIKLRHGRCWILLLLLSTANVLLLHRLLRALPTATSIHRTVIITIIHVVILRIYRYGSLIVGCIVVAFPRVCTTSHIITITAKLHHGVAFIDLVLLSISISIGIALVCNILVCGVSKLMLLLIHQMLVSIRWVAILLHIRVLLLHLWNNQMFIAFFIITKFFQIIKLQI